VVVRLAQARPYEGAAGVWRAGSAEAAYASGGGVTDAAAVVLGGRRAVAQFYLLEMKIALFT